MVLTFSANKQLHVLYTESHHDGNHADTENPRASSGDSQFTFAKHSGDNMVLQRAPYKAVIHGFSPDIGQKVMLQV